MPPDESLKAAAETAWKSTPELLDGMKKAVPWLGAAVEKAISSNLNSRELNRVGEVLQGTVSDIGGKSSDLSELYVKTPDFERVLRQILTHVGDERLEEKRRLYRAFLSETITSPCDPLDKQLRLLRIINELRLDQMKILTALAARPHTGTHRAQSPIQMLQRHLPDLHRDRIEGLLAQMNDLEIIRLADLNAAVAGGQPPGNCITPAGRQLLRLLRPRP